MPVNEKQRAAKEAIYEAQNKDIKSVCSGRFYKKSSKTYEQCKNCANCFKYKSYNSKSDDTPEVKFHYVDTFRKCEFYKVRPIDGDYIVTTSIYNIMYVNDLACACVIDMQDYIKQQDKETQKIYGALRKRQIEYERNIARILESKTDFLAEYNSYMDESVQPKLKTFIDELQIALNSVGTENSKFVELTEVARTMVGYSVLNVEKRVEECLKFKKDSVHLRGYKLNDMLRVAENFSDWVSRKCKNLDLNKCENVMNAYRELDRVLTDREVIGNALYKAREFYD